MIGNTTHRCSLFQTAAFSGKGNLQFLGHSQGVIKKHFIKIAQTIKKNAVLVLFLCLQILLHHGSQL